MKILCISHEYPPIGGGGATACKNITRQYVKAGHPTTVITAAFEDMPIDEQNEEVQIYRLKCKRKNKDHSSFKEMLSFLFAAFIFLPSLMKKTRFDVVHIFFGIPSGPLGWYIKKRYNIPYIVRLGGGDVPGTQKRFDKLYFILAPFIKRIWKNALYVVANSSGLLKRAKNFYDSDNFCIIPNGINIENYPVKKHFSSKSFFNITTTARIIERKGIQHIIEALPKIIAETNGNIIYTIIGDGPYRTDIETLIEKLNISKHVYITGMLTFDDVIEKLKNTDIFVLTSHWEGMPNVVLEAMAMHLPIIMTNCEGSDELVTDNGYIINIDTDISKKLFEHIIFLYNNRKSLANMGKNSYYNVCNNFTWEKTAKSYINLFNQ